MKTLDARMRPPKPPTLWDQALPGRGVAASGAVRGDDGSGRPAAGAVSESGGATAPGGPHLTLSMVHNCTFTVSNGGSSVRGINPSRRPPVRRAGGKRSKCRGFSRASRRRLLELIGSIDLRQVGNAFFITLTARAGTMDWGEVERRRRVWEARLQRVWAGYRWFGLWKKEPHANGSPHLHYVVYFLGGLVPNLKQFRTWKDAAWSDICGEPSISHAVLIKENNKGPMFYISKYCSKPFESEGCGRVWGLVNRKLLPLDRQSIQVSREVFHRVERWLVKFRRARGAMWRAFDPAKKEWSRRWPRGSSPGAPRQALERCGYKCRSWYPPVLRRFKRNIWQEVEDLETGRVDYRRGLDEFESVAPSLHFVQAETVRRLIRCAELAVVDLRADDDLPPF